MCIKLPSAVRMLQSGARQFPDKTSGNADATPSAQTGRKRPSVPRRCQILYMKIIASANSSPRFYPRKPRIHAHIMSAHMTGTVPGSGIYRKRARRQTKKSIGDFFAFLPGVLRGYVFAYLFAKYHKTHAPPRKSIFFIRRMAKGARVRTLKTRDQMIAA